jgi:NitT/TauT family transport system substrate-binding protein
MHRKLAFAFFAIVATGAVLVSWGPTTFGQSSDRPLKVGIVSWPGYAGGIVANGGFKPNKDSIFWTKHHQLVEFVLLEDVNVRAKLFARGGSDDVDIVWTTVDFWANELPAFIESGVRAKAVLQVDWSHGGDAIVVDSTIRRIEDLKGKRVALALLTPSHWLLENALKQSALSEDEIAAFMKTVVAKDASPDARADFVAGKVDAAVVWEPDVTEALNKRPGAHILVSTRSPGLDRLIADCMVARENFITQNPNAIQAFVSGWLDGTALAKADRSQVVRLLMENEPLYKDLGEEKTRAGLDTVRWADLNDNAEMFGLDGRPALFNKIFAEASQLWIKRGYVKTSVAPTEAVDLRFLNKVYQAKR